MTCSRECGCKGKPAAPGQARVLLSPKANEDQNSPAAYLSPLRIALIDRNKGSKR